MTTDELQANEGELLTTEQLAKRWGMHPGSLSNMRGKRVGPKFIKLGKGKGSTVLYRMSDVLEYENNHTIPTKERG